MPCRLRIPSAQCSRQRTDHRDRPCRTPSERAWSVPDLEAGREDETVELVVHASPPTRRWRRCVRHLSRQCRSAGRSAGCRSAGTRRGSTAACRAGGTTPLDPSAVAGSRHDLVRPGRRVLGHLLVVAVLEGALDGLGRRARRWPPSPRHAVAYADGRYRSSRPSPGPRSANPPVWSVAKLARATRRCQPGCQRGEVVGGDRMVAAHVDGRWRALENEELLGVTSQRGDALHGGGAGADDPDALVSRASSSGRPAGRRRCTP